MVAPPTITLCVASSASPRQLTLSYPYGAPRCSFRRCARQAICFEDRTPGCEGQQGDMPFMAAETKNSRGGWNRVRIDNDDAFELLAEVRQEFEVREKGVTQLTVPCTGCALRKTHDSRSP